MSYRTIADIVDNAALTRRIVAAAAKENIVEPESWVAQRRWDFASEPGWDTAWESFLVVSGQADPGNNEAVITDGMILAAVQALNTP